MFRTAATHSTAQRSTSPRRRRLAAVVVAAAATTLVGALNAPAAGAFDSSADSAIWYSPEGGFVYTDSDGVFDEVIWGAPTDIPVLTDTGAPAVWRPSDKRFRIDLDADEVTDITVLYGTTGDIPLGGRAGRRPRLTAIDNVVSGIGVFRPSDGRFRFDHNFDGRTDRTIAYGTAGDIPLVADVNGDDSNDIGIWRPADGTFRFDLNLDGRTDKTVKFGAAGDIPFAALDVDLGADLTIHSHADLGIYRPSDSRIRIDRNGDGRTDTTRAIAPAEVLVRDTAQFLSVQPVYPWS